MMTGRNLEFAFAHVLLAVLVGVVVLLPNAQEQISFLPLIVALCVIEIIYLIFEYRSRKKSSSSHPADIIIAVWLMFLVWDLAITKFYVTNTILLPSPESVFAVFVDDWSNLSKNIVASAILLAQGYVIGVVVALFLGVLCGSIPRIRDLCSPIAAIMVAIPITIFIPYFVGLFRSFTFSSLLVIILGVFWARFLGTMQQMRSMDPDIIDNARMLGYGRVEVVTKVYLPYLLPSIIRSLKPELTMAVLMLNFAEMIGASAGIGFYIERATQYTNYPQVIVGIIITGILVSFLLGLATLLEKHAIKWRL